MKLIRTMAATLFLAGSLLAVPAFALDNGTASDTTVASAPINSTLLSDKDGGGPGGPGGPGGERHGGWRHKPFMSDEQLEKFAALKNQYIDSTTSQRNQAGSLKRQLQTALAKADVSRTEVLALQSQINTVKGDLATKRMSFKLDALNLMTPEQKEHFRHHMLMASAFGGHHKHHGGGCGGGGCGKGHEGHGGHHHGGPGGPGGPRGAEGPEGAGAPQLGALQPAPPADEMAFAMDDE